MANKVIFLLLISQTLIAQVSRNFNKIEKPKYELGMGLITLNIPNYPGASTNQPRYIPFPWIIYRGDLFRSDEEGTRARLIDTDVFELGFSGGFNFKIESDENSAREGMPDKPTLFGLGPNFIFRFLKGNPLDKLSLAIGVRINYAIDGSFIKDEGWAIEPKLRYWRKFSKDSGFTLFSGISVTFGDQKYNAFFYDIDQEFRTAERAEYKSKSGLVDISSSLGVAYDYNEKASFFAGGFYSNLSTSANKESFLVENEHNSGIIFGMAWLFFESDEIVK